MSSLHRGKLASIFDTPLDPSLVSNTPRLLEALNKADRLQKLLNRRDERGYTLLHIAAEKNQPESLKCLLIKEANPNVRSSPATDEVTPLHIAANLGHLACLQLLVQSGGDIMARDNKQLTPIDYANISGQDFCLNYLSDVVARRLTDREEVDDVLVQVEQNLAADNVQTLVHWKQFNTLFPMSVPINDRISPSDSLLYRQCVLVNDRTLVRTLSRLAKDIPHTLHDASLLHAACRYGRLSLTKVLTDKVPQIALSVTSEGYNALHIAVAHSHLDVVKLLTQKQISWLQRSRAQMAESSLHSDPSHGVAKFGTATMSGHTVLHFAVAVNNLDILICLLKHHRELQLTVDTKECGYTPLHLAVYLNRKEAVELLLRKDASPNVRVNSSTLDRVAISRSPLAEAVINKNMAILNILLEHNADDKHHDALNICIPSRQQHDFVIPLLGSLVKHDERQKVPGKKERRIKMSNVDWSSLNLVELMPHWIKGALAKAVFLRAQTNFDYSRVFEYVTTLMIQNNKLTTLPQEVFMMPKLTTLNASNNQLEVLPELDRCYSHVDNDYIWPCPALNKIVLSKNSLEQLPEFLFSIPSLSNLDLSHNRLRKLPFDVWKAPKLHHFTCSFNMIDSIPTNWPHVLSTCNVIDNSPSPKAMVEASGSSKHSRHSTSTQALTSTTLKKSSRHLPAAIAPGTDQSDENHSDNEEEKEATPISKLQDCLNISNGNLPIVWESGDANEDDCDGLTLLNLSNNQITSIPENFPCLCPNLVRLDLSHNQINSIVLPTSFPSSLKYLNLSYNPLLAIDCQNTMTKALPCTNYQVLQDSNNTIIRDETAFCAHRCHRSLLSLSVLELIDCQLKSVNFYSPRLARSRGNGRPPKDISQSTHSAASGDGPTASKQTHQGIHRLVCPLVTRLVLSHNELTKVPSSVCEMTALNSLDLSYNDIINLPAEMGRLSNLWEFPLAGLKLISPPHNIIERGKTKDIIGFLWSLLQKARPYHRMKLMLVGKACRGKTTLLEKISEKGQRGIQENWAIARMNDQMRKAYTLSTVGIVVSDWTYYKKVKESQTSLKSITFMTWDFGGQEEYYATHQCFLSRRSLYLVVWNVTHGRRGAEELKPWLLNIQARAPHSPVIIVGTHMDKLGSRAQKQELQQSQSYIENCYGTERNRKEGYPQIKRSMLVSCKTGSGISSLRDVIFDVASQVKESTVTGRGIGCGRIPEYRLLMDQLVPASYLQLEDTVRNIALNMRLAGRPPVLSYVELREAVFADPRTLISRNTVDRELEQAVRFLHDNGTMLHYDDPLLSDLYFVDPQWLCDMLAHIVTVREINPFVKEGIMRISDFRLVFKDQDFPIRWQKEYIRLLTTFEVAVELGVDELLIPSTLPPERPNLPQCMFPDELKTLPPLHHVYIVPFIPSGFWPRLMSRLITDSTLLQLAKDGCSISDEESCQLSWVKWRTGLILQYGNLNLLVIDELNGGMFPNSSNFQGIKIFSEDRWKLHHKNIKIFGISVQVPDVFPILKYPEHRYVKVSPSHTNVSMPTSEAGSDPTNKGYLQPSYGDNFINQPVGLEDINSEFEKLVEKRESERLQPSACGMRTSGSNTEMVDSGSTLQVKNLLIPHGSIRRAKSSERLSASSPTQPTQLPPELISALVHSSPASPCLPVIDEKKHDIMRAGLLSKVIDHISLLIDDWFTGVRPRTLVVPCPHCTVDHPHTPVQLRRSFSMNPDLLTERERKERKINTTSPSTSSRLNTLLGSRRQHLEVQRSNGQGTQQVATEQLPVLSQDPLYYAFRYNDCVVKARTDNSMFCLAHGDVELQHMAPDTLFLTQGKDILIGPEELHIGKAIGKGAFATVFEATLRKKIDESEVKQEVALKALTKEYRLRDDTDLLHSDERSDSGDPDVRSLLAKPPTRHSIVEGFNNLKKELSILSPLKHPHVVKLIGVLLRPLGLVLELAPKKSLKSILGSFNDVQRHLNIGVMQATITQVASAIQYLHSCNIIYRDLKSDNILVWQFPDPHDSIPYSLGVENVTVKLSDYGISQFVATQGARGLVGTPGFMAPEILKYQGKEVYTNSVDIFSFGMFLYELITLHIPYESLTAQQANQANERGSRPSLTKKDFPCPVLLREIMVWCWQQDPLDRPKAEEIIATVQSPQFPRLLDGIRFCDAGVVTATCIRVTMPTQCGMGVAHLGRNRRKSSQMISPPIFYSPRHQSSNPLDSVSEIDTTDSHGVTLGNTSNAIEDKIDSTGVTRSESESLPVEVNNQIINQNQDSTNSSEKVAQIDSNQDDSNTKPIQKYVNSDSSENLLSKGVTPVSQTGSTSDGITSPPITLSQDRLSPLLPSSQDRIPSPLTPSQDGMLFHRSSSEEPRQKSVWSPRSGDQSSPSLYDDDQQACCELWVASNNARHSKVTVIEYSGKFTNVKDIEVGDSAVLCLCPVRDKVWMGFEIGYLMIYDSVTKKPVVQVWMKQHKKVLSIVHIPSLKRVYVGLSNGSVLMYHDELPQGTTATSNSLSLELLAEHAHPTQTSACLLVVPMQNSTHNGGVSNSTDKPAASSYELWVGQKGNMITILDAETLKVVQFIQNELDLSIRPSYMAYLSYAHLVCGVNTEQLTSLTSSKQGRETRLTTSSKTCVSVYGALYHGQYVTRWNAETKQAIESFNCREHLGLRDECKISALHYSNFQLYVGLTSGRVVIMDAFTFNTLTILSCHRGQVGSLLSLNMSLFLQQQDSTSSTIESGSNAPMMSQHRHSLSEGSVFHSSSGNVSPASFTGNEYSPSSLSSVQSMASSNQLLTFGMGFKSYYDGPEAARHLKSGFLLIWDSDTWDENSSSFVR